MKRKIILALLLISVFAFATGCAQTDVVARYAASSFDQLLEAAPVEADPATGSWRLTAPDQAAKFFISQDFSATTPWDVWIEADAQPFIDAGLDPAKLPAGAFADGQLRFGRSLDGSGKPFANASASFAGLVKVARDAVGYHDALDHYGIALGGGHALEWAKDLKTNDKDLVFVIDPAPLVAAGVDPAKVTGWVFAPVEMMDDAGKTIKEDKFLKPFDLQ
jgi:hypothetical protein